MFIELVELLRCVRKHDDSWLVASIQELRERSIVSGMLGCPICDAEYPIVAGVADFSAGAASARVASLASWSPEDLAARAGGYLGLGGGSGVIVLGGEWSLAAAPLVSSVDVRVIAANAPDTVPESASVGLTRIANEIPLAERSCAGIALDDTFSSAAFLSGEKALRPGARMAGPAGVEPPRGLKILARDESWWIGEKPPEVTPLRRGSR
jgi:hypothetical protein